MILPRIAIDNIDPIRGLILNSLDRERQTLHTLRLDRADAQSALDTVDLAIVRAETRISAYEAWLSDNP